MSISRRTFIATGSAAVAAASLSPPSVLAAARSPNTALSPVLNEALVEVARKAVDAASGEGAAYADARLTNTSILKWSERGPVRTEQLDLGVRALVNGYWGFSVTPVCTSDEAVRAARRAVAQARIYDISSGRPVELSPVSEQEGGHWDMPVEIDPFEIPFEEINDFMNGLRAFMSRLEKHSGHFVAFETVRQDKAFVSSEQQVCTQRLYRTGGSVRLTLNDSKTGVSISRSVPEISIAGSGWEYFKRKSLRELILKTHEDALEDLSLDVVPLEIGRVKILVDPWTTATLVSEGIGQATELDRIMGYEANSAGTSYITDPSSMMGSLKVGASNITVVANRMPAESLGNVRWDDEGVKPRTLNLVDKGILRGLQTSRESGSWLAEGNISTLRDYSLPMGSSIASDATSPPIIASGDLELAPFDGDADLNSLRQEMGTGIEFYCAGVRHDFQRSSGLMTGHAYNIRGGKRVNIVGSAGVLFKTTELWKNVIAGGGAGSSVQYGRQFSKGEPLSTRYCSVSAVPIVVQDAALIDVRRKA